MSTDQGEVYYDDNGQVDEIIAHSAPAHFEMLDENAAMLRIGGVHLTLVARGNRLVAVVQDVAQGVKESDAK